MTLHHITWALHGDHPRLDPAARLLLVALADHAGQEGVAWPSRTRLARMVGVSVDTIDRRMRLLIDTGVIRPADDTEIPAGWATMPGNRRPTAYVLQGPQPAAPSTHRGRSTAAQGPQASRSGAAAVRHKTRTEPRTEPCAHGEPRGPHACALCRSGVPA